MHFQDSLLCKWKQGEKRNCPHHGTRDNQRNYRTVQLQAERYQGYLGCQGQQSHRPPHQDGRHQAQDNQRPGEGDKNHAVWNARGHDEHRSQWAA